MPINLKIWPKIGTLTWIISDLSFLNPILMGSLTHISWGRGLVPTPKISDLVASSTKKIDKHVVLGLYFPNMPFGCDY